jgi:tetratricopeptide (TPR) repeat protein
VAGRIGSALEFDGTDDYVNVGESADFALGGQGTIALWVRTNDAGNGEVNPYITHCKYGLKHKDFNALEFYIFTDTWHIVWFELSDSFNGDWHHLAGTYGGGELKLYIDGTLEGTSSYDGTMGMETSNITMGAEPDPHPGQYYRGDIDDVRIYNYALNEDEIGAIYASALSAESAKQEIAAKHRRRLADNIAEMDRDIRIFQQFEKPKAVSAEDRRAAENLAANGWQLWNQRKFVEAEEAFKQAVEKDPDNANAWNGLGWSQFNRGKPLNAKVSFEKCLEIEPSHAAALNGLGWIAKGDGSTDEAIGYWEKAVAAAPTATAALNGLAVTYMERKEYDEATKYYEMWLDAEPDSTDAKEGLEKAKAAKQQ